VRARVDPGKPAVELVLEIRLVGKDAPGLEVRLRIALQPLDGALGLRVGRLAEMPADAQLAAEGGKRVARPAIAAVNAGLTVPDQRLRQAPEPLQAAGDPGEQVLGLAREDQDAGARARVAQTRDDDPAATPLGVPDRDLLARLPDVELADLART